MLAALLALTPAWAQVETGSVSLRPTAELSEAVPEQDHRPIFIVGDQVEGRPDLEMVIQGNAQLRRPGLSVRSGKIRYDQRSDTVSTDGEVYINDRGNRYTAASGQLRIDAFEGYLLRPTYHLLATGANGQAERIDFIDPDRSVVTAGSYTTCQRPGPDWVPDWLLRADELKLDQEEQVGVARGAKLEFKDVPVLALPKLTFPLGEQRQSGWLPPTVGLDSKSGMQLSVPWYWNIAPNRDATFTPTVMTRRGVDLAGQFRYLEDNYEGTVDASVMPADRLRDSTRWSIFTQHDGRYDTGQSAIGPVGVALNLRRVSDDDYWRDFNTGSLSDTYNMSQTRGVRRTTRELVSSGALTWARGDFSASLSARKTQVLQDVSTPIEPPYDKLPQLTMRWGQTNRNGFDYSLRSDVTRFHRSSTWGIAPNIRSDNPANGTRGLVLAQVERPLLRSWGFVKPKLKLHASHYLYDDTWSGKTSDGVAVPTFSLDNGLVFEREAGLFGRGLTQTLEPRLKYVYTPYRDQSGLPNYDSGMYDFNFATIWSENAFAGHDRVSDNNLVTAGLTTRFLDPDTGAEALRLEVAQRYRFSEQRVVLPGGDPERRGWSDLMLGAGIQWNPKWGVEGVMQYNPDTHRSSRATVSTKYLPAPYHSISAAYRYDRDRLDDQLGSKHLDLGWQWPLADIGWSRRAELGRNAHGGGSCRGKWYTVGRLNYSFQERKMVDAIVGFEYDAGCWIGRVVFERIGTGVTSSTKRIMFQIELIGLSRLGTSSLETLRDAIPRYRTLSDTITPPSRFQDYE
ncbi:MAG: LPS-assembly protein LptD [Ottowia sp.]|nr:LPS-assembly protein LptD [Ottowia sp.]